MQLTCAGRIWATRQLCAIWIVGVIIYITAAGNYGQVLAGRFIMGLGIGQVSHVFDFSEERCLFYAVFEASEIGFV